MRFVHFKHIGFIVFFSLLFVSMGWACKKVSNTSKANDQNQIKSDNKNSKSSWKLVFQEDFDGDKVNEKEWLMYHTPGHNRNGLRRPSAFSVSGGILTCTAQMIDGQLVSGGMANRRNYKYGKFEFRVRTDADPSEATSGVVLTWPESEKWPIDGENDIYETLTNPSRDKIFTYIHYGADNSQHEAIHHFDAKEWQTVAMEWAPDAIKIYVNGDLQWTLNDTIAIPDVNHHLCIQLDAFKKIMGEPVTMQVDWVKIYQASK